jgi:hypothetical protein
MIRDWESAARTANDIHENLEMKRFENTRAPSVAYSCPSNTLKLVELALKRRQALVWGGLV